MKQRLLQPMMVMGLTKEVIMMMNPVLRAAKGGKGGKGGGGYPSKTGNPSGGGRTNGPRK